MFRTGINPYGLTYHLGLQGKGTPRENSMGAGLEGFIAIATELSAQTLEIFDPWLEKMNDDELAQLSDRLKLLRMTPVISAGLNMMGPIESAFRSAKALGANTIRLGLSPVLEGSRNAWGEKWFELIASIREGLAKYAPMARDRNVSFRNREPSRLHQPGTGKFLQRCRPRGWHLLRHRQHLSSGRSTAGFCAPSHLSFAMCISRTTACSSPMKATVSSAVRLAMGLCHSEALSKFSANITSRSMRCLNPAHLKRATSAS